MGTAHSSTNSATIDNPLDLAIVGAGLSGIDLAHHVSENFPEWNWEIHDANDDLGGTWHTFTYPGIRSDSDMPTFTFPFRRWPHDSVLGQGQDIKEYLRDAARACGALERLHTKSWIKDANWRTDKNLYEVTAISDDGERVFYTRKIHYASGYYSHGKGFRPDFPGEEDFTGQIIHPQAWPEHMDYAGKKMIVIGSGATAITLVPALEEAGADVTMLQRSPSYVAPIPGKDNISNFWNTVLPARPAYTAARFTHSFRDVSQFVIAQRAPKLFKRGLRQLQEAYVSPEILDEHFTPSYRPWDQRVCKAPDGDFFTALNRNARVVTGIIDRFTADGIRLTTGEILPADVIITATGLEIEVFGGGTLSIDGQALENNKQVAYRGMMVAGLPNFSFTVGYVNASWTLRADLVSRYMIKLWKTGEEFYAPELQPGRHDSPLLEFDAGYINRGKHRLPVQGEGAPWKYTQNYLVELPELGFGDQRKDMVFGQRCLDLVGAEHPGPEVHTIRNDEPFTETNLAELPATETVNVAGRSIRIRRGGPAKDRDGGGQGAVVMIHGIGRSLEDWDDQAVILGKSRRYIAIDIPGFGLSDPASEVTIANSAALLWDVLDALGETKVNLAGNSLGGALAMEMTAQRPAEVASVFLVDSAGFGESTTPLLRLVAIPGLGKQNVASTRFRALYAPMERHVLRRPGAVTKHRLDVQGRIARHPHRNQTYYSFVRQLGTPLGIKPGWREGLLDRFKEATSSSDIPVMLTWGSKDAILPYKDFRAGLEQIQVNQAVVFDNCGHMPQLEFPAEFAEQYQGFLADVADSAAGSQATSGTEPLAGTTV